MDKWNLRYPWGFCQRSKRYEVQAQKRREAKDTAVEISCQEAVLGGPEQEKYTAKDKIAREKRAESGAMGTPTRKGEKRRDQKGPVRGCLPVTQPSSDTGRPMSKSEK